MVDEAYKPAGIQPENRRWSSRIAVVCLLFLAGLLIFGAYSDHAGLERLQVSIREIAASPWGVPLLILTVCVGAFIAVPQFMLIGVAVYAFGPLWGAVWFWCAALCSGQITFWLGWFFGSLLPQSWRTRGWFRRLAGLIARNTFAASAIIRNIPTGPFIMVNMLFGAMHAHAVQFFFGMAIGIIPKILLIAFGWQAIKAAFIGELWIAIGAGLMALMVWIGSRFYINRQKRS